MAVITFDTLKFVERLTAAGVPDAQARAEASALRDVLSEALDTTVATKGDIARLENNRQAMELRMTMRLGAMMVAIVSIAVAFLKMHP